MIPFWGNRFSTTDPKKHVVSLPSAQCTILRPLPRATISPRHQPAKPTGLHTPHRPTDSPGRARLAEFPRPQAGKEVQSCFDRLCRATYCSAASVPAARAAAASPNLEGFIARQNTHRPRTLPCRTKRKPRLPLPNSICKEWFRHENTPRVLGLALALSLALPLTGCGSMLERSYASVTPHTSFMTSPPSPPPWGRRTTRPGERLLHLVEEGEETGVIRLYQYSSVTGSAASDVDQACQEATREDPWGLRRGLHPLRRPADRVLL